MPPTTAPIAAPSPCPAAAPITAPADATVERVAVSATAQVEGGDLLVVLA